jgi:hypothetical protein
VNLSPGNSDRVAVAADQVVGTFDRVLSDLAPVAVRSDRVPVQFDQWSVDPDHSTVEPNHVAVADDPSSDEFDRVPVGPDRVLVELNRAPGELDPVAGGVAPVALSFDRLAAAMILCLCLAAASDFMQDATQRRGERVCRRRSQA